MQPGPDLANVNARVPKLRPATQRPAIRLLGDAHVVATCAESIDEPDGQVGEREKGRREALLPFEWSSGSFFRWLPPPYGMLEVMCRNRSPEETESKKIAITSGPLVGSAAM